MPISPHRFRSLLAPLLVLMVSLCLGCDRSGGESESSPPDAAAGDPAAMPTGPGGFGPGGMWPGGYGGGREGKPDRPRRPAFDESVPADAAGTESSDEPS